jgi:hypothetical protein
MCAYLVMTCLLSLPPTPTAKLPLGPPPTSRATPTATVENDRNTPVEVYVEIGEAELHLGTVPANNEQTFPLPSWLTNFPRTVDFFIHPTKGFDEDTGPLELGPSEHLGIIVPGARQKESAETTPARARDDSTVAEIQNDRATAVTVYLERGNAELTLGTIPAETTASFAIPRYLVTSAGTTLEFFFHPKNGFDVSTGDVTVHTGERFGIEVK